jgi:ketosteroid isomerase-like protein
MKMNRTLLLKFIAANLVFIISACSSPKSATSPDEIQIREARNQSNLAIANHDSVTITNYWTDDFHIISSRNFEVAGREANRQIFALDFKTKKDVIYVRTAEQIELFLDWDMASETGTWTGQWQELDGLVKLSGTYYAKWHKVEGVWKIRAEIFTPLSCSGSSFCNQSPKLK